MPSPPLRAIADDSGCNAAISAEIAARTGIDDAMIERLVRTFYDRTTKDRVLAPIFVQHVDNWDAHIAKICDFWSAVALKTRRYQGTPMSTHMALPLTPEAFKPWLALFAQTAREVRPEPAASHFIERAERIANGLEMGAADQRGAILAPHR